MNLLLSDSVVAPRIVVRCVLLHNHHVGIQVAAEEFTFPVIMLPGWKSRRYVPVRISSMTYSGRGGFDATSFKKYADSLSLLVRGLQRLLLECGLLCQFPQRRWRRNCHQLPWIHYSAKKFHYILVGQMIAQMCNFVSPAFCHQDRSHAPGKTAPLNIFQWS